ncbi:Ankyrin repeat protein 3 [Giardia muris]|uniref:Ankyrin repeat protein 3 n=1 Tax=Giardia muris TaxID=5742 RepID=A0A4Z1SSK7_GIAMU|nr:Ankyrin repeat protein 3 [Giardia muris]|eukprot:TNJ27965.1 Ankyrin repeat protein 3 [Giardia muris]
MSLTDLMEAAERGDLRGVKRNFSEVGKRSGNGWTALMYTAANGHAGCIPLLKEEIGMQNEKGWTALMWAAHDDHARCARILLSEAGKRSTKNCGIFPPGITALMIAARRNHLEIVELLLPREQGLRDNNGWTALMLAASKANTECARLLLSEAGAQSSEERTFSLNGSKITLPSGVTALMLAAHENHPKVVELLLPYEQGMTDSNGHTAQWYAHNSSRGGDFIRVRKLLKNEGSERILPPPNPGEMLKLQEGVNKLTTENESLKNDLSSSKNTLEETKNVLSQLNREVSSLKQQLQKANDKAKKYQDMCEDLQKLSDQKQAFIDQLVKEAASLRQTMVRQNTSLTTFLIEVLKTHGTQEPRNRGPMPAGSLPEPAVKREV